MFQLNPPPSASRAYQMPTATPAGGCPPEQQCSIPGLCCPFGTRCKNNVCHPVPGVGKCESSADCHGDELCRAGQCVGGGSIAGRPTPTGATPEPEKACPEGTQWVWNPNLKVWFCGNVTPPTPVPQGPPVIRGGMPAPPPARMPAQLSGVPVPPAPTRASAQISGVPVQPSRVPNATAGACSGAEVKKGCLTQYWHDGTAICVCPPPSRPVPQGPSVIRGGMPTPPPARIPQLSGMPSQPPRAPAQLSAVPVQPSRVPNAPFPSEGAQEFCATWCRNTYPQGGDPWRRCYWACTTAAKKLAAEWEPKPGGVPQCPPGSTTQQFPDRTSCPPGYPQTAQPPGTPGVTCCVPGVSLLQPVSGQPTLADIATQNRRGPSYAGSRQLNGCVTTSEGLFCCVGNDGYWYCRKKKVTCSSPGSGECGPFDIVDADGTCCRSTTVTWRPGIDPEPVESPFPFVRPSTPRPSTPPWTSSTPRPSAPRVSSAGRCDTDDDCLSTQRCYGGFCQAPIFVSQPSSPGSYPVPPSAPSRVMTATNPYESSADMHERLYGTRQHPMDPSHPRWRTPEARWPDPRTVWPTRHPAVRSQVRSIF